MFLLLHQLVTKNQLPNTKFQPSVFITVLKREETAWPQVFYKPHCQYQNFSPLANGVYLIAIINKPHCVMEIAPLQTSLRKWE